MKRSDTPTPIGSPWRFADFPKPGDSFPLSVYRDFVDMLFSMRLPIFGLGAVFVGVCVLVGPRAKAATFFSPSERWGCRRRFCGSATLRAYSRARPVRDFDEASRRWERRYAIGNYASAVLRLRFLNLAAIAAHYPLLHLITVSLVFWLWRGHRFADLAIRPKICVTSSADRDRADRHAALALAPDAACMRCPLHAELFLIEAFIVAMITGLSLQTVAHLYRSAVEHHTARHDMAKLARTDALTGSVEPPAAARTFQDRAATAMPREESRRAAFFSISTASRRSTIATATRPGRCAARTGLRGGSKEMVRGDDVVARPGGDHRIRRAARST